MISAQVICDSISPEGKRLTTFKLRYPKFIHGEFMTHRVISRNASSSRAIPVAKLIAEVEGDVTRAGPVWWGAEQKGMASGDELSDAAVPGILSDWAITARSPRAQAKLKWAYAANMAAGVAREMVLLNVHKSIVNRLLEPFSHINVVATATEWDNFFGLRLDRAAQPEMRTLAERMWAEWNGGRPCTLGPGVWHLPFIEPEDEEEILGHVFPDGKKWEQTSIAVSVARCARVSYESFDTGKRSTIKEDLKLYERLVGAQPLHASPTEHQATPDNVYTGGEFRNFKSGRWQRPEEHGNFVGWRQYRKMLPGEACAPLPKEYLK